MAWHCVSVYWSFYIVSMRVNNSATRANYMSDFPLWLRNRHSCFLRFWCFEVSISSFDVFHGLLVPFLNDLIFTLKLYSAFKERRHKVLCKPAFNILIVILQLKRLRMNKEERALMPPNFCLERDRVVASH